jgi:hypothetical protein
MSFNRQKERKNGKGKEGSNCEMNGHDFTAMILSNRAKGGGDEGNGPKKERFTKKAANKTRNVIQKSTLVIHRKSSVNQAIQPEKLENKGWILDSGASDHYSNDKSLFNELIKLEKPIAIAVANKEIEYATHSGSIDIVSIVAGKSIPILLTEVLYVKTLDRNLLYLGKIGDKGCKGNYERNSISIIDQKNKKIGEALRHEDDGLYYLQTSTTKTANKISTMKVKSDEMDINIWHSRLGHIGEDALRLTINGLTGTLDNCNFCQLAKHRKVAYNKKDKRDVSAACLETIFSDVIGPMQVNGDNGERYAVTYIDDHSDFTTVKTLKTMSEQEKTMLEFIALSETEHGKNIKKIVTDNGGEYITKTFEEYCKLKGINHQRTNAYNPQQNGKAERRNQVFLKFKE